VWPGKAVRVPAGADPDDKLTLVDTAGHVALHHEADAAEHRLFNKPVKPGQ